MKTEDRCFPHQSQRIQAILSFDNAHWLPGDIMTLLFPQHHGKVAQVIPLPRFSGNLVKHITSYILLFGPKLVHLHVLLSIVMLVYTHLLINIIIIIKLLLFQLIGVGSPSGYVQW